ncbi:predicted protein [Naegleria gruberi]|uniref:Predicted protein n=1 Tax=Naegleria gruberi TaxID=5762 RepID=D2W654_NAEGR|nr:uncharacterized protein NAEGRDRAFT_76898 [Naegleria gruberi]EFC35449.1 predicted protein [Naegleria gruberi]|eukprot:XP_002668193.1 predicted protein [Naegleria gruberi strain NEG-M]
MREQHDIPIFIVGGAVRDVIREVIVEKKTNALQIMNNIKDIDIGFGCDPQTFHGRLTRKYKSGVPIPGPRGLVQVGSSNGSDLFLEGKAINGLNNDNKSVKAQIAQCYGTNLRGENICRDFTCNSLWYDPINKCIIDTIGNGQGIKDVISKNLRIPVKPRDWEFWVSGNPTKLMRFYKFLLKGYSADAKTKSFIIEQVKKLNTRKELEKLTKQSWRIC